jgi:P-type E1-E2 ATPase
MRFLAVLVVATPCPLLIAIPVAIIGSISLAAKRAIIVRDPVVLERIDTCRTMIFDKTGTLTYGKPQLVECLIAAEFTENEVLALVASLEQYSKHPLGEAIVNAARAKHLHLHQATQISEPPGQGLTGQASGQRISITSRKHIATGHPEHSAKLPEQSGGLECVVLIDDQYAGLLRFRDAPRREGVSFVSHLGPRHGVERIMLVSGDRESEVQYLADKVGIKRIYAGQTPEEKLEITRRESKRAPTLFVGDGINDAPALMAATVGVAWGANSDVTIEAAGAVVLDNSLEKIDELMHIGRRMRNIALQSVIGGMSLSIIGMLFAAAGYLPPVAGAIIQEFIDIVAVVNALRAAIPTSRLTDFD